MTFAPRTRRPLPWLMLAVGVLAQAAGTVVVATPAFLIPLLHVERGLPLDQAGLLATAPNLGLVLTLIAWGGAADRWGERNVLALGLAIAALATLGATLVDGLVPLGAMLVLAGAGTASVNAASGRVVVGWFPPERRGLAMGIRQSCQPLGVAAAAIVVPALVAGGDIAPALVFGAILVGVSAVLCLLVIIDPPRPARADAPAHHTANPYRRDGLLWRIHAVSVLLVVPQYALSTFGLVWLQVDQGWDPLAAGILVAVAQFLGALGRIGVGWLSDRVGSRLRPLRWVALAGIAALLLTAAAGGLHLPIAVAVTYVLASCIAVADNGLAFTSVAEIAGPFWSGRALGAQNTGQFLGAALVGPGLGALITLVGYPIAFALVALAPAVATPLIPKDAAVARLRDTREASAR
ncbi:MFS transporter [Schumannella sp. 10F1B-5-1]|uniref:MFS transporter n=1 Tax=Schumannella sp. 10F1B-5-1 TaxID=2590780 RepID=UPI001130FFC1|nr:MFS transporter [Schumannella sp. 10F1B-5-1]TPW70166.1 MFS transporter [Schumannella sp. 10F1B-5-1]